MGLFSWLHLEESLKDEEEKKSVKIDFSNFKRVTDFIYEKSGITELDKRALTASRLQTYAKEEGVYSTSSILEKMKTDTSFYQEVMNIATINESFFLREEKELKWLVKYIKKSTNVLDILVLPCSSGEEVYSILLLLLEENISLDKININGCDLNSQAILSAKKGEYDTHSLHNIDTQVREKYFTKNEKNLYAISSRLREKANFYQENIFEIDTAKKRYDIVLSRNMLIYFDDQNRKKLCRLYLTY